MQITIEGLKKEIEGENVDEVMSAHEGSSVREKIDEASSDEEGRIHKCVRACDDDNSIEPTKVWVEEPDWVKERKKSKDIEQ